MCVERPSTATCITLTIYRNIPTTFISSWQLVEVNYQTSTNVLSFCPQDQQQQENSGMMQPSMRKRNQNIPRKR
jgi:hypothetical protein